MRTLGEIIRLLREEKGIQQKELADILNVHRGSISNWEQDKRTPDKDMLIKIADYFNVTVDYLFGRTNIVAKYDDFSNISILGKRIRSIRNSLDLKGEEFGKLLNVSKQAVSGWENGYRTPDVDTLSRIADLGNVSSDYLLGRTDNLKTNIVSFNNSKNSIEVKFQKGTKENLTEEHLQALVEKLEAVNFDIEKLIEKIKNEEK